MQSPKVIPPNKMKRVQGRHLVIDTIAWRTATQLQQGREQRSTLPNRSQATDVIKLKTGYVQRFKMYLPLLSGTNALGKPKLLKLEHSGMDDRSPGFFASLS